MPSEPAEHDADRADTGAARAVPPAAPWAMERTVRQLPAGVGNRQEAMRVPQRASAAEQVRGSTAPERVGTQDGTRHPFSGRVRELCSRADQLSPGPTMSAHRSATDAPRRHGWPTEEVGAPITEAQRAPYPVGGTGREAFRPFLRAWPCWAGVEGDHDRAPSYADEARSRNLPTLHDRRRAQMSYGRCLPALDATARGRTAPRATEADAGTKAETGTGTEAEANGAAKAKDAGYLDLVTGARKTSASALKPA
ncbi:hypothetical protein [Kitasatospora sp. NPDC059327]|uniref:hypothetical protein n=1 Tax=Kitasatospora sp. NPDC059327 TaxID=3346803 RepID=UPI0036756D1B